MVVNIRKKRELIGRILGVGANRIRFEPDKLDDVADSITRENIRSLIKSGSIWTTKIKGTSRGRAEAQTSHQTKAWNRSRFQEREKDSENWKERIVQ